MSSSSVDFSLLKVPELKKELKSRGLSTAGNKHDLVERLQLAAVAVDESDDLLNDDTIDDAVHEAVGDEDEALLNDDILEDGSVKSDVTVDKVNSQSINGPEIDNARKQPIGKPVSNPKSDASSVAVAKTDLAGAAALEGGNAEKLAEGVDKKSLTDEEKKELRASRFNLPSAKNQADQLRARAERFNLPPNSVGDSAKSSDADLEKLKKRAERFGASTSSALVNSDVEEKKKARLARFGATVGGTAADQSEMESKKLARLQRFGGTTTA